MPPRPPAAPSPSLGDHLRVLGLLLTTLAGVVPFVLHLLAAPIATPIARRRMRRALAEAARHDGAAALEDGAVPDGAAWAGRTVFVVAGEPSGDRLAARVVTELRAIAPGVVVRGYGGPALAAAGAVLDRSIVEHAVVGFTAVVASLPTWWRLCAQALAIFRETPPDLVLTVDFPGLNLRLARWARRRGIRTVHLVAPQTWAWAPWRTARVRRAVDRLLVTFPFEEPVFRAAGIPTTYVGHPLFEAPLPPPRTTSAPSRPPTIELRPGSRRRDVRRQAPLVLDAAARLARAHPGAALVVRIASDRARAAFDAAVATREPVPGLRTEGAAWDGPVDAALSTSGTSTAELAAALVPMVVFYRVSPLGRLGKALLVTSPFVAMANLLAGAEVVRERLVGARGGATLAADVSRLLDGDGARWIATRAALEPVRARLARADVCRRIVHRLLAPGDGG